MMLSGKWHTFQESVQTQADHDSVGKNAPMAVFMVVVHVAMFNTVGKLLQEHLDHEADQNIDPDIMRINSAICIWNEVQDGNGKKVGTTEGKDKLQQLRLVTFDKEYGAAAEKGTKEKYKYFPEFHLDVRL